MGRRLLSYTTDTLSGVCNDAKQAYLKALKKEGLITEEAAIAMSEYCIVVANKGFFGRFWDKLWKDYGEGDELFHVVKLVNIHEDVKTNK